MASALNNIRILDLTRVLAGPWCAQNLADLGAEVIKVEKPGAGDDTRTWGPPFLKNRDGSDTTDAAYYLAANRGKQSIAIDISTAAGQQAIKDLAKISDVVLENYKVGQLKKYGLDYDALSAINPKLVYCSVTGFGQTGPWKNRAGYDFIIQGVGGFMSVTGEADDQPGGGPQKAGVAVADLMTGMYATQAVLAALFHRERTGEGQYIDLALLDVQVAMMANMNTNYLVSGQAPKRWGNAHPNLTPYQTFKSQTDWIIVASGNDVQFHKLCAAGGRAAMASDPRFATNPSRVRNREAMITELKLMISEHTAKWWIEQLEAVGVPCGPINNLQQTFENPQVQARGLRMAIEREDSGPIELVGSPMKFSKTPVQYTLPPPRLGEHTEAVLKRLLGYSDGQIAALK